MNNTELLPRRSLYTKKSINVVMFYFAIPSFRLASRADIIKSVFGIPKWYVLSEKEEQRLFNYIMSTETVQEAIFNRILDCSTFCDEASCYFCLETEPVMCRSRVMERRD